MGHAFLPDNLILVGGNGDNRYSLVKFYLYIDYTSCPTFRLEIYLIRMTRTLFPLCWWKKKHVFRTFNHHQCDSSKVFLITIRMLILYAYKHTWKEKNPENFILNGRLTISRWKSIWRQTVSGRIRNCVAKKAAEIKNEMNESSKRKPRTCAYTS